GTTVTQQEVNDSGVTPLVDIPTGIGIAYDPGQQFGTATVMAQQAALVALAQTQNPTLTSFSDEPCTACHFGTHLFASRTHQTNTDPAIVMDQFTSTRAISIVFGQSAQFDDPRQLGWPGPVISQRVANETALALDDLDTRYPPTSTTTFLDAG